MGIYQQVLIEKGRYAKTEKGGIAPPD